MTGPAGVISSRVGAITSAGDSLQIRLFGRGARGSTPQASIDPVENVIPDEALIKLNVRTYDESVRKHVLGAIDRIVRAEAAASGAPKPPEITTIDHYDLVKNDPEATRRVADVFREHFPPDRVRETGPTTASAARQQASHSIAEVTTEYLDRSDPKHRTAVPDTGGDRTGPRDARSRGVQLRIG